MYNTIAGYRRGDGTCVRVGNYFFDKNTFLRKEGNEFYYDSVGDHCRTYEGQNISFIIKYRYFNKSGLTHVAYNDDKDMKVPDPSITENCNRTLRIGVNYESIRDELLIQKFFSDYYVFTGIVFLILGIYLCFFAKYKKPTKFIICTIFGEIFSFTLGVAICGIHYLHMEWAFFVIGLALGGFLGYFSLGGNKLYRVLLALSSGFIFGLVIFDILFTHLCSRLSQILLMDTLIIIISLFVLVIYLQHSFHYFYDSIIGGYVLVRGFCLLIHKAGKYARYRELNLHLYLLVRYEVDLAKYYYENEWPIYYVYTIFMLLIMGGSIIYYFFKLYKKEEEYEIEKNAKIQMELLKENTTLTDENKEMD